MDELYYKVYYRLKVNSEDTWSCYQRDGEDYHEPRLGNLRPVLLELIGKYGRKNVKVVLEKCSDEQGNVPMYVFGNAHSQLEELDYAHAHHTGFQKTLFSDRERDKIILIDEDDPDNPGQQRTRVRLDTDVVGDKNFVFYQAMPSAEWHIKHDLNKYPSITVFDETGNKHEVVGDVEFVDKNNVILYFEGTFSGTATLN